MPTKKAVKEEMIKVTGRGGLKFRFPIDRIALWYDQFDSGLSDFKHALKYAYVIGKAQIQGRSVIALWYEPDGALFVAQCLTSGKYKNNFKIIEVCGSWRISGGPRRLVKLWRHKHISKISGGGFEGGESPG